MAPRYSVAEKQARPASDVTELGHVTVTSLAAALLPAPRSWPAEWIGQGAPEFADRAQADKPLSSTEDN